MMSYAADSKLPIPTALARVNVPLVTRLGVEANHASDLNVRADLAHLDSHLDRADGWIEDGAMGGSTRMPRTCRSARASGCSPPSGTSARASRAARCSRSRCAGSRARPARSRGHAARRLVLVP